MNLRRRVFPICFSAVTLLLCLGTAACKSDNKAQGAMMMPPPLVSVLEVTPQDVPIFSEYAAQTYARDMVEVRGRVEGFIEKRLFQVGSDVQAGQVLYVLDVRPYQASVDKARGDVEQAQANLQFAKRQVALAQAQADLAQAQANLVKAEQDVNRLKPLVQEDAAAQQDLDNALSALQANKANVAAKVANVEQNKLSTRAQIDTAQAQVESNKALLRTAQLNLDYATIKAPIGGRIGDTLVPVGGLVTPAATQPLTTIVPLDPIWVRFKVSEGEYLAYQQRTGADKQQQQRLPLELILANNSVYPYPGHFQNSVNQVDPKTGTLELQATFPNPKRTVLPGQFGKIRLQINERKNVILVPQRAVQEMQGLQSVMTVGPENKALVRSVMISDRVGENAVIAQGLKPGDEVIVDGLQKVRPGAVVNPQPYRPPAARGSVDSGN